MRTLTIFTPTYNRAHLLLRLYESLCAQTCKDFEWIIVDDGSTDNTSEVVEKFIAQQIIDIKYHKQPNGGKCRAINSSVAQAQGYLFMIVDSDDMLYGKQVITDIVRWVDRLKSDETCCGIIGDKTKFDKTIIGNGTDPIINTSLIELREKYCILGDKEEVIKTSIMRDFPFPQFEGENFMPEAVVWNRIAQKYTINYTAEPYVACEYQPDGLTAQVAQCRAKNPQAFMLYYSEYCASNGIRLTNKIKRSIAYWATALKTPKNKRQGYKLMVSNYWFTLPLGWLLHKMNRL